MIGEYAYQSIFCRRGTYSYLHNMYFYKYIQIKIIGEFCPLLLVNFIFNIKNIADGEA